MPTNAYASMCNAKPNTVGMNIARMATATPVHKTAEFSLSWPYRPDINRRNQLLILFMKQSPFVKVYPYYIAINVNFNRSFIKFTVC